jgi:hypothetical protein
MVVGELIVERLMVVAAEPEPMTTTASDEDDLLVVLEAEAEEVREEADVACVFDGADALVVAVAELEVGLGASLVVGAAVDVSVVDVDGGKVVEAGAWSEVVEGSEDVAAGAVDLLAPVPMRAFWRFSIHGRLLALTVEKSMMRAKNRATRLGEGAIGMRQTQNCR